jgi:hypothetical protein
MAGQYFVNVSNIKCNKIGLCVLKLFHSYGQTNGVILGETDLK